MQSISILVLNEPSSICDEFMFTDHNFLGSGRRAQVVSVLTKFLSTSFLLISIVINF